MALKNMEDFVVTFEEVKVNDKVRETYRKKNDSIIPPELAGTLSPLVFGLFSHTYWDYNPYISRLISSPK